MRVFGLNCYSCQNAPAGRYLENPKSITFLKILPGYCSFPLSCHRPWAPRLYAQSQETRLTRHPCPQGKSWQGPRGLWWGGRGRAKAPGATSVPTGALPRLTWAFTTWCPPRPSVSTAKDGKHQRGPPAARDRRGLPVGPYQRALGTLACSGAERGPGSVQRGSALVKDVVHVLTVLGSRGTQFQYACGAGVPTPISNS